jgi:hypothetical protein
MEIDYIRRTGPRDPNSPTEGALEDGQELPVLGRKLVARDPMPNYVMRDHRDSVGFVLFQPEYVGHGVGDAAITIGVNELFSRVCLPQIRGCLNIALPPRTRLIILTNEPKEIVTRFIDKSRSERQIPIYSTHYTNTGIRLGMQLERGDLQRSQIAAVKTKDGWVVVGGEYAYDQGDPEQVPDIKRAIASILAARA